MKKNIFALIVTTLAVMCMNPVLAITDGELDADNHPAVVLIVMDM